MLAYKPTTSVYFQDATGWSHSHVLHFWFPKT